MERKNINRCLGGLRMEDQGERSPQTFPNFSFPQPGRKQGDRCAFRRVLNTDSGFKAAAWTLENKNGSVHIRSKLNSAFSTIGKATADKITAKLVGKTHAFAFAWITNSNTRSCSELRLWNFEHFNFVLLDKFFCLILNENLLLLNFLSRFFHLVAFILEF